MARAAAKSEHLFMQRRRPQTTYIYIDIYINRQTERQTDRQLNSFIHRLSMDVCIRPFNVLNINVCFYWLILSMLSSLAICCCNSCRLGGPQCPDSAAQKGGASGIGCLAISCCDHLLCLLICCANLSTNMVLNGN